MGSGPLKAIGRVIFWRYRRGGWQYDILCAVIILFIFLTPKSVFDGSYFHDEEDRNTGTALETTAPQIEGESDLQEDRSENEAPSSETSN